MKNNYRITDFNNNFVMFMDENKLTDLDVSKYKADKLLDAEIFAYYDKFCKLPFLTRLNILFRRK